MARVYRLPELMAGLESAMITSWDMAVGTEFETGAVLATAETDKAAVELEAEGSGVLLATLVGEGAQVPVEGPLAVFGDPGEKVADLDALLAELGVSATGSTAPADDAEEPPAPESNGRIFASPLVRKLAAERGIDLATLAGTGPPYDDVGHESGRRQAPVHRDRPRRHRGPRPRRGDRDKAGLRRVLRHG